MKYIKHILLVLFLSCLNINIVNALSCSNSVSRNLGTVASYVNAKYEVFDESVTKDLVIGEDKTTYRIPNYTFEMSIYNITDDIYVDVKDDYDNSFTVRYSDTKDGIYTFTNSDFGRIYNYTITVMSNNGDCYGQKIRSFNLIKPKYNAYSEYTYCQNSSVFYCQRFVTKETGITSTDDFLKKIKTNSDSNKPMSGEEEIKKSLYELFLENWMLYSIIFVIVIIVSIVIIIVIKKKNKNKGWTI